jgi:hypothetical protein
MLVLGALGEKSKVIETTLKDNAILSENYRKGFEEYGKEKKLGTAYFDMIKNAKTVGDVKKGFEDLKLDFNSFTEWYQKEYLVKLRDTTGAFTGTTKSSSRIREEQKAGMAVVNRQMSENTKAEDNTEFFNKRNTG